MQLTDFDFPFDSALIASHPIEPREEARLLLVPRKRGSYSDSRVAELPYLLESGDLIVVNDTKVLPVRLSGTKVPGGGKLEMTLVRSRGRELWDVLLKGRVKQGQTIEFGMNAFGTVIERNGFYTTVKISSERPMRELLDQIGQMPLPPYIKRKPTMADRIDYQTMFARTDGAMAAPTAGLHFTPRLLDALRKRGIRIATITLHVGPGTFRPVTATQIAQHHMDSEWCEVPMETINAIGETKTKGGRVVAIGTTVVRSLEAAADRAGKIHQQSGETNLFITPGYTFRVVDAMITNFHLPRTTLLMLVAAFAGFEQARGAYEHAIAARYRFYSYGDAMLIR